MHGQVVSRTTTTTLSQCSTDLLYRNHSKSSLSRRFNETTHRVLQARHHDQ